MARNYTSFAVGSQYGPRSARWIVSVDGDDVYVTTAKSKKHWHVSLHRSGRWHLKRNLPSGSEHVGPVLRSHRSQVPTGNYAVGLYICIPDSCLRPASDPVRTSNADHWLPRPAYGGVVELAVMQWKIREVQEDWPGLSAGTELRLAYCRPDNEVVGVLTRYLSAEHPDAVAMNRNVNELTKQYKPVVLDSPERRGYIAGTNKIGSIVLTEYAID